MTEEYYIEYYDNKGRRGYTKYYLTESEAKLKADDLIDNGFEEVTIVTVRY